MIGLPNAATDTHAHIFEPTLTSVADARYVPDYAATLDQYLDVLTAHGVDRGVLVQPSFLGSDNSYLLSALAAVPDRLRGVIVVSPEKLCSELSAGRVEDLHGAGVRGVRLNLIGQPLPDLFSPSWQSAAVTMAKHGWHLEIQASGRQWLHLAAAVRAWPGKLVIDHLGLPQSDCPEALQAVLELALFEHVWVKVSGPYRSSRQQAAVVFTELVERGCGARMVFGSDWPFTRHEDHTFTEVLTWAQALAGDDLLRNMMSTNPATLLGWPAPIDDKASKPMLRS
ncbi:amidohydrolase family protein [Pseudarthrobacter sp. SL88]|uniref:amidohydrolase family protein n=1 Tax=Pseudarthrobacter sp. SL88 TaxID=2994666 RepID=UPI002275990C|nr:amidohydrolase family protein [Pseudarthrobacter sp. SL88]MCY1674958.1 amidohydrolase family protein [Pseudarthrobacter sp. SL88]